MNKKQFFMLSLLACPFLYQETLHAGIIRNLLFASAAVAVGAVGVEIYKAGEHNKTLSVEKQTRLAKEGHPYLDATLEMAKNTADRLSPLCARAAKQLENASNTLQTQREEVVPALIEKYNPFGKSTALQELEKELEKDASQKKLDLEKKEFLLSESAAPVPSTDETQE